MMHRLSASNAWLVANVQKSPITPLTRAGTGKTYASAFAMRELGYKKVLFLVHRNQIAKQAIKSYHKVFGNSVSMGMMSSALGRMEYDKDYILLQYRHLQKMRICIDLEEIILMR